MGGSKLWSEAAALNIIEEVHRPNVRLPYRMEMWRSFRQPTIWGRGQSSEINRAFARTRAQGWNLNNGTLTRMNEQELRQWNGSWRQ